MRPPKIRGEVKITQYAARRGARVVGPYAVKITVEYTNDLILDEFSGHM